MDTVLVSTLGSEPQVVALAVQLLSRQGISLQRVAVLHTALTENPICDAFNALVASFAAKPTWRPLHTVPIPARDVLTPMPIDTFAQTIYEELRTCVQAGTYVHLLLAVGRKSMAMVGITISQLLLGPNDRVWHLDSDDALRLSGRFDLCPGDQARLVPIPLPQFNIASSRFNQYFLSDTPEAARHALAQEQQRRTQRFVDAELTPAERDLAALAARAILTVQEMAGRLHKLPKTITNQLNTIYAKLESTFGLQPGVGVKREFLRHSLGPYGTELGS